MKESNGCDSVSESNYKIATNEWETELQYLDSTPIAISDLLYEIKRLDRKIDKVYEALLRVQR